MSRFPSGTDGNYLADTVGTLFRGRFRGLATAVSDGIYQSGSRGIGPRLARVLETALEGSSSEAETVEPFERPVAVRTDEDRPLAVVRLPPTGVEHA